MTSTRLVECAKAIARLTASEGMPPTIAEVSLDMGLRGAHAYPHIRELERRGLITRRGPRSIQLTGAGRLIIKKEGR